MTPKPPDLALLERLAREATPGPWRTKRAASRDPVTAGDVGLIAETLPSERDRYIPLIGEIFAERERGKPDSQQAAADAAFIAALDPSTVLALVAGNRRADELAEALSVAYAERNLVAQLAAALGMPDYPAWWGVDPAEPDWPVLYIDLGAYGQVSWHMPRAEVLDGGLPETGPEWDGHSTETKDDRIRRFVIPGAAQPSVQHSEDRS